MDQMRWKMCVDKRLLIIFCRTEKEWKKSNREEEEKQTKERKDHFPLADSCKVGQAG